MSAPFSFDPKAFDRQFRQLSDLAEMLGPDGRSSHASYVKALTELHRTLLERNEVIGRLYSATGPRSRAGISLDLSPLDLDREQRTLHHAVGLIALPGARVTTFYDVLRELRATNRWWRTKIYELELTQPQRASKEAAAAIDAYHRLTVDSMVSMLPGDRDAPSVYAGAAARDRDAALMQGYVAPRVLLNEEREKAFVEALASSKVRRASADARSDKPAAAPAGGAQPAAAAPDKKKPPAKLESLERIPHLGIAPAAPLAPGTEFEVKVWADTNPPRSGERSKKIRIDAPGNVTDFNVDVSLWVTRHFDIVQSPMDKLLIQRGKLESEPLTYKLRVKTVEELEAVRDDLTTRGRGCITAAFAYRGHPCGRVWLLVPLDLGAVDEDGSKVADGETNREHVSPPTAAIAISEATGPAADMVVDIMTDKENDGRSYHCKVTTALATTEDEWKTEYRTALMVSGFLEEFTAQHEEVEDLTATLRGAGLALFRTSPRNFQDAFWRLIDAGQPPRTIQVNSEEPHYLWELMVPHRDGKEHDFPLGVDYDIARWLTGTSTSAPAEISIENSYVVAPKYRGSRELRNTPKESKLVCDEFAGVPIAPETFARIRDSVKTKPVSLVHFACHGSAGGNGTQQSLELANNSKITPGAVDGDRVLKSYMRTKHPFLFLNACEIGRPQPSLRSAGGFPAVMMGAQACAVIAPAWSVKDGVSYAVATAFYRDLKANPGKPIATIMREIRRQAFSKGEDSYAAYCFFGNVHATLSLPSPS